MSAVGRSRIFEKKALRIWPTHWKMNKVTKCLLDTCSVSCFHICVSRHLVLVSESCYSYGSFPIIFALKCSFFSLSQ